MAKLARPFALLAIVILASGAAAAQTIEDVTTAPFRGQVPRGGRSWRSGWNLGRVCLGCAIPGDLRTPSRRDEGREAGCSISGCRSGPSGPSSLTTPTSSRIKSWRTPWDGTRKHSRPPQALSGGYAEKTIASMKRGLEIDPDFVYGHLAIGGWNAKIIDAAGFLGAVIYGASEDAALAHYQRATELAPDNVIVMAGYAIGLLPARPRRFPGSGRRIARAH